MKIIHKGFVYENINTFNDFTVYSLREEFKNKQFNDIEQAQTYFKKYCEVQNIDHWSNDNSNAILARSKGNLFLSTEISLKPNFRYK